MDRSPDTALIVFAWGNSSRGDDAIGPMLAERLRGLDQSQLAVVEDFQLNIEHVMDFNGATPLLFIDASVAIDAGIAVEHITASEDGNFSTHAISPQALLNVYRESTGKTPPPAYLLHVAAKQFDLGESLGTTAGAALEEAWSFLKGLVATAPPAWHAALTARAQPARSPR